CAPTPRSARQSKPSFGAASSASTRSSTGQKGLSRLCRRYHRAVAAEPQAGESAPSPPETVEDIRAVRPYVFSRSLLRTAVRRLASIAALMTIDVVGLVVGLYAAQALRSLIFDPKPILWGLLWDHETSWLAFLILLLLLVFWQAGLYRPRGTRGAAERVRSH